VAFNGLLIGHASQGQKRRQRIASNTCGAVLPSTNVARREIRGFAGDSLTPNAKPSADCFAKWTNGQKRRQRMGIEHMRCSAPVHECCPPRDSWIRWRFVDTECEALSGLSSGHASQGQKRTARSLSISGRGQGCGSKKRRQRIASNTCGAVLPSTNVARREIRVFAGDSLIPKAKPSADAARSG
jgi:hypothetical protein